MAHTLRSSVIDITPKLAAQWLKTIKHQRSLNEFTVQKYIHQLESGEWALNGETIKFDSNGALIDGQHRLQAIVQSGKKGRSLVVRGVDPRTVTTIDTGRNRDFRDTLTYAGIPHASFALGSAIRWVYRLTTDPHLRSRDYGTNEELFQFYKTLTNFDSSLKFGDLARQVIRSQAIGTALHYLFRQKAEDLADRFFLALSEGTNLSKTQVVYHLRERLLRNALTKTKLPRKDCLAMIIKTWNLARAGKFEAPRQAIIWVAKGPSAEDFPVIA